MLLLSSETFESLANGFLIYFNISNFLVNECFNGCSAKSRTGFIILNVFENLSINCSLFLLVTKVLCLYMGNVEEVIFIFMALVCVLSVD